MFVNTAKSFGLSFLPLLQTKYVWHVSYDLFCFYGSNYDFDLPINSLRVSLECKGRNQNSIFSSLSSAHLEYLRPMASYCAIPVRCATWLASQSEPIASSHASSPAIEGVVIDVVHGEARGALVCGFCEDVGVLAGQIANAQFCLIAKDALVSGFLGEGHAKGGGVVGAPAHVGVTDAATDVGHPAAVGRDVHVGRGKDGVGVDAAVADRGTGAGAQGRSGDAVEAGVVVAVGELRTHGAKVVAGAHFSGKAAIEAVVTVDDHTTNRGVSSHVLGPGRTQSQGGVKALGIRGWLGRTRLAC